MFAKKSRRGVFRLLCLLVCVLTLATQSFAAGGGSLTLQYDRRTDFDLYRVAEANGDGTYTAAAPFDQGDYAHVELPEQGDSNSTWLSAASTLAGYVEADKDLEPDASGRTSGGSVTFSSLETGLYLVIGASVTVGDTHYTPNPVLVEVGTGSVSVTVKEDSDDEPGPGGDDKYNYSVTKRWKGGAEERTDSVTVEIYRDGELYTTVTLSDPNWRYSWSENTRHDWNVVEVDVPDGFDVTVDRNGNSFTITNAYDDGQGGGDDDDDPDKPGGGDSDKPGGGDPDQPGGDTPGGGDTSGGQGGGDDPGQSEEDGGPKLPQTGQLWWPVLALAVCGGGFVLAGLIRRNRNDTEE